MKQHNFLYTILKWPITATVFLCTSVLLQADPPEIKPWFQQAVLLKSYQQSFDWRTPWEKREIRTQSGMALVVSLPVSGSISGSKNGNNNNLYLLTTAEIVSDATLIEVTRKDIRSPFQAKLVLMDYAANLALLEINNSKFWRNLRPVNWTLLKSSTDHEDKDIYSLKIKSQDEWTIEHGTIDRMAVGHRGVSNAWFPLLRLKGISKSSQGYPLLQNNETVGMILNSDSGGAKAMPAAMVLEFLKHAGSNPYRSLAHRGFIWSRLPQSSTYNHFQIPPGKPGIWISRVLPYGTGSDVLMQGDYLTKLGKWVLSHDGKVEHPDWGISLFDLLFLAHLKVGDTLKLELIREGKPIVLQTIVSAYEENSRLVPLKIIGTAPRYVLEGGFLFQELTLNYLKIWGANWQTRAPMRLRLFLEQNKAVSIYENNKIDITSTETKMSSKLPLRIVLVSQVIPDPLNIGYQKLSNAVVLKINGKLIHHLEDVSEAFLSPINNFHRIDFLPGSERLSVILPVDELADANLRIKNNFRIPKLQSL